MSDQLREVPGSLVTEDGQHLFVHRLPGFFASWLYPLAFVLLLLTGQNLGAWFLLLAGLYAHGIRYPRTFDVFYPLHFYATALLALLAPTLYLVQVLATGVIVTLP